MGRSVQAYLVNGVRIGKHWQHVNRAIRDQVLMPNALIRKACLLAKENGTVIVERDLDAIDGWIMR